MAKSSVIQLSNRHLNQMIENAKNEVEFEVCGLIGGHWQPYDQLAIAARVERVPNIADEQRTQYRMDERVQVRLMSAFGKAGMELVGIYHSHPRGPAYPSPTDIAEASYPDVIYLILSPYDAPSSDHNPSHLLTEVGYRISAWRIRQGDVSAVRIQIIE